MSDKCCLCRRDIIADDLSKKKRKKLYGESAKKEQCALRTVKSVVTDLWKLQTGMPFFVTDVY